MSKNNTGMISYRLYETLSVFQFYCNNLCILKYVLGVWPAHVPNLHVEIL